MGTIRRTSKWLHKVLGLGLILFLVWMSLSGVLLNHPDLIAGASVPRWLVPSQYHPHNWNRSGIISAVFPASEPDTAYLAGNLGIFRSRHGRVSARPLHEGLPDSDFYRKTRQLFLLQAPAGEELLAATAGGLFRRGLTDAAWEQVPLGARREDVRKILSVTDRLVVFTDSAAYVAPLGADRLHFTRHEPERPSEAPRVSLVKLFFDVHDGKVWGLPGRLLFDAAGLVLCYLSLSAFYTWYYPRLLAKRRRRRRPLRRRRPGRWQGRLFRFVHKYHLKLGIWSAGILLVFGLTGFFMRPPMLMLLAGDVPAAWYPGPLPTNPWEKKIRNALYDSERAELLIQASDGLWRGPADLAGPFTRTQVPVPIFVMGATVLDRQADGTYLIGSFSGLFRFDSSTGRAVDLLTGEPADTQQSMRPADTMITGWFATPTGASVIAAHDQGLLDVRGEPTDAFRMPPAVRHAYRMPLWNYLFELHNGRFFREWVKGGYILIVPLGSLLFVLITLTGVYDWLVPRARRARRRNRRAQAKVSDDVG